MKAELLSIPGIETVNFTNCVPTQGALVSNEVGWDSPARVELIAAIDDEADHLNMLVGNLLADVALTLVDPRIDFSRLEAAR